MARLALVLTLLLLVLVPTASAASPAEWKAAVAGQAGKVPAEFDERLRHQLADGTLRVMVATRGRDADLENFVATQTTWVRWYGSSPRFLATVTPAGLARLAASRQVTFVEPDYPITLSATEEAPTDDVRARFGVWDFATTGSPVGSLAAAAPGLSTEQATGAGATVAVIDSGIDNTHRDFGGFDCEPGAYQPCDTRVKRTVSVEHLVGGAPDPQGAPTTEVASGHGTHVAGTVLGNGYYSRDEGSDPIYGGDGHVFGVAPQASLVAVKNGDTLWAGLSTFGLQWVLDHGADEEGIRVINNSWGCVGGCAFNPNSAIAKTFKDLYAKGVLTVFAAGNDGGTDDGKTLSGNAQSPYTLGVAAYDHRDDSLAEFSSRGDGKTTLADPATWTPESEPAAGVRRPDVAAPGVDIWAARTLTGGAATLVPRPNAADVGGPDSPGVRPYASISGTSMATPHVAGAAALLLSACPSATVLDLMRAIMSGADGAKVQVTGGGAVARPFEAGHGALDVRASLDWLRANVVACGGTTGSTGGDTGGTTTPTTTPAPPAQSSGTQSGSSTGDGATAQGGGTAPATPATAPATAPAPALIAGPVGRMSVRGGKRAARRCPATKRTAKGRRTARATCRTKAAKKRAAKRRAAAGRRR